MSAVRRLRPLTLAIALGLSAAIASAAGSRDEPTLKDLPKRKVEIRRDPPSDVNADKATENYRRFLELADTDPALRAEALRRLGDLSLEGGELERMDAETSLIDVAGAEAIRLYTQLLAAHPDGAHNDRVLYQLARAYETTGQPEQALATLDRYVRDYPASARMAEVQFRRGELLFSARRYGDAERAYAEVTRRNAGDYYQQSLYKQGWSLFKQNLNDDSLPVFARLLDLQLRDPSAPQGFRLPETLGRADREITDDTLRAMTLVFSYHQDAEPVDRLVDALGRPPYASLLYSRLGDLHVEKQRYQDAATVYRAFVAREPNSEFSPGLSTRAIEAYNKGGFAQLVLEGKREYVEHYNLGTAFWQGRSRADYPGIIGELKTHLTDLAAFHHAAAQKNNNSDDFNQAARWYRLHVQSFPDDADTAQVNFRLADVLYEGGRFGEAVDEYERSAYAYASGPDSARAGYAALSAYQQHEALLPESQLAIWRLRATESGVRFGQTFPAHPDSAGVLTRATEDLYRTQQLPRAIEVAGILLARQPPATPAQQRIAHSVVGQAEFDQGRFAQAESAWVQARMLAPRDAAEQQDLTERLSVAVYRQAEARRAAGDAVGAVDDFLRVGLVAPGAAAVQTARYDAAAELIKLEQWPRAIEVLEGYRRDYPRSPQQSDVTQKLAVAYLRAGRGDAAAAEFERIAVAPDQPAEVRLEALELAAEQYEKGGNMARAVPLLERLVAEFPTPVPERIETRQKLADHAALSGNAERVAHWQREIVQADAGAGAARSDRTGYLAAKASLALAAPARDAFRAVRLTAPLPRSLPAKRTALEAALGAYQAAAAYNVAEVATQASFEIAELYRQLGADIVASERPKNMDADTLEQYSLLLEDEALEFEDKAIELHQANAARARDGFYDDGVRGSYEALAKLVPARFGKTELSLPYGAQLGLTEESIPSFRRGEQLREAGDLAGAAAAFADAAQFAPLNPAPLNELGLIQRQQGDFVAAADAYQRALALVPEHAPALRNLGVLRDLYLDDPAAAIEPYERYQAITGEERPVAGWIVEVRRRAGIPAPTVAPPEQTVVPEVDPAGAPDADASAATEDP
ncbi:MAG TPA: tetratricopeptide repeat protein [Steroidobacteraceae bacterium]|nr:tetratricopeptide repeat protein [Steroidobacteraceae bacterium]